MYYGDVLKFLADNGIRPTQVMIAYEVESQLEADVSLSEFEEICSEVYLSYIDCIEPDLYEIVNDILCEKGLKDIDIKEKGTNFLDR